MNGEAVTWSLAKQMYSADEQYVLVPLGFVEVFLPIIHWEIIKLVPSVRKLPINTALIAFYAGRRYYGSTLWIWSTIAMGVFSQVWLRRRLPGVYNKYNYLIGAALDGGSQVIIFVL